LRLRAELGEKNFVPRRRVKYSGDWASLEDAPALTIATFLDAMGTGGHVEAASGDTDRHRDRQTQTSPCDTYLFDWNLPDNAPELCKEIRVPVYFADDFLQQLPVGAMYRDAWPSLFVGPQVCVCGCVFVC